MQKRPTCIKVLLLLLGLFGLSLTISALGQNPSNNVILTFPTERPIADLLCRTKLTMEIGLNHPGVRRVLARGRIVLPRDCWIEIYVNETALGNMQYFDQLKGLHVYNFSASRLDFEDKDLIHLKGYQDLRYLNVESTMVYHR